MTYRAFLLFSFITLLCPSAFGGIRSNAARETAEYMLERFGVEIGEETVETLSEKIGQYGAKYGDEAIDAIRSTGPRAFNLIDDAGNNAPEVIRLLNRHGNEAVWVASDSRKLAIFVKYGDDAAEAMIKHPGVAAPAIDKLGSPAARAFSRVSDQNARRIAIMADDGSLVATGKADELLGVIARYGDRSADWVWRHKGALATTAVAAAFIADPEPFLNGAVEIVKVGGETVVGPVAEKVARSTNWNVIVVSGFAFMAVLILAGIGWRGFFPDRTKKGPFRSQDSPDHAP